MQKIIFLSTLLICGCTAKETKVGSGGQTGYENISVEMTKDLLSADNPPIVIDVRTATEYAKGHIDGAKNIDIKTANFEESIASLDKESSYIIHCRSGVRSARALKTFAKLGFKKVYHMHQGFLKWK